MKKKQKTFFLRFIIINIFLSFLFLTLFSYFCYSKEKEPMVSITVKKGDCLIKICKSYLENPTYWKKIAKINRLKNPDFILPGQTLNIPANMLKGIPEEGTVTFIKGHAEYMTSQSNYWMPLSLQALVPEGSKVRTGDTGLVEIVFKNGDSIFQKSNTSIGIDSSKQKGGFYFRKILMQTGKTITRIREATDKANRFEIVTPSAICAARGTVFRTSVDVDETTRSEVLDGEIDVEGKNKVVNVTEGYGNLTRKGETPSQPRSLLPPPSLINPRSIYKKLPIIFEFEKVANAFNYRVVLSKDTGMKDVIKEEIIPIEEKFIINEIPDGTYFLNVLSIDDYGLEGLDSKPMKINIRTNPSSPFIQRPTAGDNYRDKLFKCEWLNVKSASSYHAQISDNIEFSKIITEKKDIKLSHVIFEGIEYGKYYFRVRSIAEDNFESEWSDAIPFSIVPPPPSPSLEKPSIDKKTISIRWQDLGKDFQYHFQMSENADFTNIVSDVRTSTPQITIKKPKKPGIYYVRTSSIDSTGYEGKFSEPQSFKIEKDLLIEFLGIAGTLGLIFFMLY